MAYPVVAAPYGLKPVNLLGGLPFAGATRQYKIASAYAADIFNGDVVELKDDGTVIVSAVTSARATVTTSQIIGVFLGCSYTNPSTKQKLFSQYWPTGTVAADAVAYVADDDRALFKVVYVAGGTTTPAYVGRTIIGNNVPLVQNAGSTTTGDSKVAVGTGVTTGTVPMRVVDVVAETANSSGDFCELIVRWNFEIHTQTIASGV